MYITKESTMIDSEVSNVRRCNEFRVPSLCNKSRAWSSVKLPSGFMCIDQ